MGGIVPGEMKLLKLLGASWRLLLMDRAVRESGDSAYLTQLVSGGMR